MTEAITINIDGIRFAAAHKAVAASIGRDKADTDCYQVIFVDMWEGQGVRLSTFDGMRTSYAYVPMSPDWAPPEDAPDYSATIRADQFWHGAVAQGGSDSDTIVQLETWTSGDDHLPGLEPPPGVLLSIDSASMRLAASAKGLETVYGSPDFAAYIGDITTSARAHSLVASATTFKAVGAIAAVVGDLQITQAAKSGADVVVLEPLTPVDELGYTFKALMSWSAPA